LHFNLLFRNFAFRETGGKKILTPFKMPVLNAGTARIVPGSGRMKTASGKKEF
jgi:hypothetical protein